MLRSKSLRRRGLWWSRGGSNPRPLRCELANRQNAKYLPFRKLQPPKKIKGFPVLSHSLPSRMPRVLFFLATYWPLGMSHLLPATRMIIGATRCVSCPDRLAHVGTDQDRAACMKVVRLAARKAINNN